jgi:cytochrome b pre-mRNA-processing protein 3
MSRAQPSSQGAINLPTRRRPSLFAWRSQLRARRAARAEQQAAAHRLYRALVDAARTPGFFRDLGVPDTPEGRFEMIGLHAALVLLRLKREGAAGKALGQTLFDLMMADMDQSLRELGIGDLGVGRHVQRLAGQFYARLHALDTMLGQAGAAGRLGPMLRANVWAGGREPNTEQVAMLAEYLSSCQRRLDDQSAGALLRGESAFAELDARAAGGERSARALTPASPWS